MFLQKRQYNISALFVILFVFLTISVYSQAKRPKIGLVLSGGGAKGIAHIGILKAMEEAGLTPDYITGTSMGSIVGGLYSIGYSADELKEIVEQANWDELLTNRIPLDKVTFEEKYYYGRYLLDFYIENKKLQLPKGIIEGQALMELFSNLTRPVHGITDFNDFPIPFACVGSNIVTGEPVVLNSGSLAMAMRASMAIPSIFTPVKIGEDLLVDGGLVRNMPVPEVLEMGADIVIGVFVSSDLNPEEDLNSAISVLSQSAFITSAFDSREQMKKCNILIVPNLDGFSTGSFQSGPEILERGNEAGQAYYEVFKNLADSLKQFGPLHQVVKPKIQEEYIFSGIEVKGNQFIQDEFIIGKMEIELGEPVSINRIEERQNVVFGTQYFEKMWYEIVGKKDQHILRIHVVERPKIQLRFSYHYDSENKGGIVGNITMRNLILNRSRLIFEADLATHPSASLNYFKYLGKKQNMAIAGSGIVASNELPLYDSITGNQTNTYNSNLKAGGIKLQSTRTQNNTYGIEVLWTNARLTPKVVSAADFISSISKIQYNNTLFLFFYQFNNYNDRYFPTRGLESNFHVSTTTKINGKIVIGDTLTYDAENSGGAIQTSQVNELFFNIAPIIPVGSKFAILSKMALKISNLGANTLNLTQYDFIGGFSPGLVISKEYLGAGPKEFVNANYFYARMGLQYEIKRNIFLQAHVNYLDSEYPVSWLYADADIGKLGDRYRRFGYGGLIGLKSPVGPIAFAFAKDYYRSGWKTSLIIGFVY